MEYTVNVVKPKDDTEKAISGELTLEVQKTGEKENIYNYKVVGKGTLTNLISPFTNGSEKSVVEKPTIGPVEIPAPFDTFSISKAEYDRGDTYEYELAIIDNLDYLLLLLRKEFEKTFGIAMNFKLEWKAKKKQTAPAENKAKPVIVAKWLSTVTPAGAKPGERPLEIGFEVLKDGESIIKRDKTVGFNWDEATKKISVKAGDIFYSAAGKWIEGYGKEPFIEKDVILFMDNFTSAVSQTAPATSGTSGTSGSSGTSAKPIQGDYTFDVTTTGYLVNAELGKLKIISKEEVEIVDEFLPGPEEVTFEVSEEYKETLFEGAEELFEQNQVYEESQNIDLTSVPDKKEELPPVNENSTTTDVNFSDTKVVGGEWKKYDIEKVLKEIDKTKHKPSAKFRESLKKILLWMKVDKDITDPREASYLLGTAFAESGYSLQRWEADYACTGAGIPYGSGGPCSSATNYYKSTKGGKANYYNLGVDSKGQCYFGRGLIQLTGKANYEKYGKKIGVDLVSNGDLAMKEDNSYKIAVIYLSGRTFKYVKDPSAKFTTKKGSWTGLEAARRSVNGGTKGLDEVNGAYKDWLNILNK